MKKLSQLTDKELFNLEISLASELAEVKLEGLHRMGFRRGPLTWKDQIIVEGKTDAYFADRILDHGYVLNNKVKNQRIIVGEPYDISTDYLKRVINNPRFIEVTARTLHFPGKTIGIHFRGDR